VLCSGCHSEERGDEGVYGYRHAATTIHPNSNRLFTPGLAPTGYVTLIAPCPCTPQGAVRAHCSSAAAGNGRER
jgi:hypothetical protein